jgi:ClpP class serine protease
MRHRIRHIGDYYNIPVLTFCEQLAASGGYYVMIGGDTLYAQTGSIIGSIGAMFPSIKVNELIQKYGVERRGFYSTANSLYEAMDSLSESKPE